MKKNAAPWWIVSCSLALVVACAEAHALAKKAPPHAGPVDLSAYKGRVGVLTSVSPVPYGNRDLVGKPCHVEELTPAQWGAPTGVVAIWGGTEDYGGNPNTPIYVHVFKTGDAYSTHASHDALTLRQDYRDGDGGVWWQLRCDGPEHDLRYSLALKPDAIEMRDDWKCEGRHGWGDWVSQEPRVTICQFQ